MKDNEIFELIEQIIDDRLRVRNRELIQEIDELLYSVQCKPEIKEIKFLIEKFLK